MGKWRVIQLDTSATTEVFIKWYRCPKCGALLNYYPTRDLPCGNCGYPDP